MDAAARPFPREETTPPVTKMYLTGRLLSWLAIGKGSPHQRLDSCQVGGRVYADSLEGRRQHFDPDAMLQRAQLLQALERFKRSRRQRRKARQERPPVAVQADVPPAFDPEAWVAI